MQFSYENTGDIVSYSKVKTEDLLAEIAVLLHHLSNRIAEIAS
jgi:hypothetical protein